MTANSYITRLRAHWFTPVNNSPLIVFRILFGAIMLMEFGRSIARGWVDEVYIRAPFRFTFIGFEFLQQMNGEKMYWYFGAGCLVSVMVALGLFYRYSSFLLAVLWTGVYFSQKAHYNNHFYLMVIICWMMFQSYHPWSIASCNWLMKIAIFSFRRAPCLIWMMSP